jgi:hypothetical protein
VIKFNYSVVEFTEFKLESSYVILIGLAVSELVAYNPDYNIDGFSLCKNYLTL